MRPAGRRASPTAVDSPAAGGSEGSGRSGLAPRAVDGGGEPRERREQWQIEIKLTRLGTRVAERLVHLERTARLHILQRRHAVGRRIAAVVITDPRDERNGVTLGGPAHTRSVHGITNADWYVVQGGDGFHCKVDPTDPDTVYAGVEDAALFESNDGGKAWKELSGLRQHDTGPRWQPGAGGMCLHTILINPKNQKQLFVAISAAGAFRTDDAGKTWKPINKGLVSQFMPDPKAEVGHCVHRIAFHPSKPSTLFMQKHWDVMRSDDSGDSWKEVSDNLPTDFGFPIDVHAHEPETIYVVPIKSDSEHYPLDGKLQVWRSRTGGNKWEVLTKGLPQKDCYVNVLRDAMSVDQLDPCGIYFGTTGGQVYASADSGDSWNPIVRDLPAVLSVEAQTLK